MDKETSVGAQTESVDLGRREALAKLGAYAAFTVPAVTALLVSEKASALSIDVVVGDPSDPITDIHVDTGDLLSPL
jgi:hypothetical protein